jgi:23S rRNA pseudouridine2457 synthase
VKGITFPVLTNPSIYESRFCGTLFLLTLMFQYYLVYKPFQVLSQFSTENGKLCLKNFFNVEKNVYPIGRLDYDSEGLLLLTNDKKLNHQLLHPSHFVSKEYLVQVEGNITEDAIQSLQKGVTIQHNGTLWNTQPCKAKILLSDPVLPERTPPIRFRKNIPAPWISIEITEGKNRQVRKMTAAVGFPTLRLVRVRIGNLHLEQMQPGDCVPLTKLQVNGLLGKYLKP